MNLFGNKNKNRANNKYPNIQYKAQPQVNTQPVYTQPTYNSNPFPVIGVAINEPNQANRISQISSDAYLPQIPIMAQVINRPQVAQIAPMTQVTQIPYQSQPTNSQVNNLNYVNQVTSKNNINYFDPNYQQTYISPYNQDSINSAPLKPLDNTVVLLNIENPEKKVETSKTNKLLPITPRDLLLPSAPPFNAMTVTQNKNDKSMEPHYQELKIIQDAIKYQLEYFLFKKVSSNDKINNSITININNITTLEFKKITEIGKVIYLLKILFTTDLDNDESKDNPTRCCHLRIVQNLANTSVYKVERCLTDMRPTDELGYLDI